LVIIPVPGNVADFMVAPECVTLMVGSIKKLLATRPMTAIHAHAGDPGPSKS
jgi:hypothetical protein